MNDVKEYYLDFNMQKIKGELNTLSKEELVELITKSNDKEPIGIVLNAFSEPFILDKEVWELVEKMKSRLVK